ncbi:MAG: hypothetical protein U0930_10995 [Pirellulales bacterium]
MNLDPSDKQAANTAKHSPENELDLAKVYIAPNETHRPSSLSEGRLGLGVTIPVTGVFAIAKWTLPVILGTGPIFSLGSWIEEWILVILLGAFIGAARNRPTILEPSTYFLVGYVLTLPLYGRDKFVLLILAFGIATTWLLVLAMFAGAIGRRVFSLFTRA